MLMQSFFTSVLCSSLNINQTHIKHDIVCTLFLVVKRSFVPSENWHLQLRSLTSQHQLRPQIVLSKAPDNVTNLCLQYFPKPLMGRQTKKNHRTSLAKSAPAWPQPKWVGLPTSVPYWPLGFYCLFLPAFLLGVGHRPQTEY